MGDYSKKISVYPISNLKKIRMEKYPDIRAFAKKIDYSTRTIERAESGKNKVRLSTLSQIAIALGIDKDDIMDKERSFPKKDIDSLSTTKENKYTPYFKLGMKNYTNINNREKLIKVKYMGRTGHIYLEDGDKLNTLFFTTDINKPLDECKIDISMTMKESNFLKVVDKLYDEYKNKPLQLNGVDESLLTNEDFESLNKKIISLRLGEEVTMRTIENDYMEIVDFYPKASPMHQDEIYNLVQSLLCKLVYSKKISLTDSLIPMGFEMIDKIIRCSLTASHQISTYIKENFVGFLFLRELFIILTYILIDYINDEVSEEKAQKQINEIHNKILSKINLLKKLDGLYGLERATFMYNMGLEMFASR